MLKLYRQLIYTILISKDFFNIIAESSLIGVAIFRKDKVIYSNDRISDMLGLSGNEIVGKGLEAFSRNIHKDDVHNFSDFFSADNPVPQLKIQFRFRKKSGMYDWYESNMMKITKDNDEYTVSILTDITEQKKYEQKLIENESKYKSFIEKTSEGVSYLEFSEPVDISLPFEEQVKCIYKTGIVAECNLAFAKMYGIDSADEIRGKSLFELHGGDSNPVNINAFLALHDNDYNVQNVVSEEITVDGRKVVFLNNSVGIIKDNHLVGIWGTQIDITDRQKSHELISAAFSISEAAHESGNLEDLFSSIHKIVSSLMPAKNFYIAIYDRNKDLISFPYFVDEFDEAVITQKPGRGITEYVIRTGRPLLATPDVIAELEKTGEIIPIGSESIDWLGVPLKVNDVTIGLIAVQSYNEKVRYTDGDKNILEFVSAQVAMTIERKRSQEALKQSESKNRALLSALPDLIFVQDYDGVYLDYHTRSPEILFVPPEKFLGANMREILPGYLDELFREAFRKAIDSGEISVFEYPLMINGEQLFFEARIVAFDNDKILSTIRDVSQKNKIVKEILAAKENAEELNRLKTNFLANMSHELRTPLHGILGFAQILAEETQSDDQRNMIMTIYKSGKRLLETLNLILNFSRVDANKYELVCTLIDVKELVMEVVNLFAPSAENKSVELECDLCSENIYAELDERLLRDILNNLINNAIKFTEKGRVKVYLKKYTEHFVLEVEDTGIGIPEDKYDLIFQEFRQESEGLSRNFEGTGLGLTITKSYVELMKGSITVKSKLGAGTRFTVTLPLKISGAKSYENQYQEEVFAVSDFPAPADRKRILLVENDKVSAVLVKTYISKIYNVDAVSKGEEALEMARENIYDAVLMDINLGEGMTGIDTTRELKNIEGYRNVPIIAVTAFAMETDKDEFLKYGCSHYIAKPFDKSEILNLLNSIFSGQE